MIGNGSSVILSFHHLWCAGGAVDGAFASLRLDEKPPGLGAELVAQDEVRAKIVDSLAVVLTPEERELSAQSGTTDVASAISSRRFSTA